MCGCGGFDVKTKISQVKGIGNTNGNIHNDGTVILNNDWVYYTNFDENNHLYKKKVNGSDNKQLVNDHYSYNLNIIENYIYYISGTPGSIYRVDINGKKDELLIDTKAENLIVTDENIFYRLSYDNDWGKLYRTDLNGKNEVLIAESIIEFSLSDGWIYYSNREDNNSLYKMDFNGENITKLNNKYSININVEGGYIYYTDFNEGQKLYSIKTDGTGELLLSSDICWEINLHDDYIYYRNQTQQGRIYRMKIDGTDNRVIIDHINCVSLNITNDFLIYRIPNSEGGYFKAELDGTNNKKWANSI